MAALNVLKGNLAKENIGWTEIAIPHDTGANVSLINMVTGGNPPNVFMNSDPGIIRDLAKQGLILDLTKFFTDNGIAQHFPPTVLKEVTVDGKIYKAPAGIHIDGMVYYNMDVAAKAGVDPAKWASLDAMWTDFPKIKAAGFQPLAVGSQDFQVGYLTHALIAAVAGPSIFDRFYGPTVDPTVFDEPALKDAIDWVRKFSLEVDPGSQNRAWNDTTNMVITGKALMQIHGDWMKGEWRNAGKVAGKDFGCIEHSGHQGAGGDGRRLELPRRSRRERRKQGSRARRTPRSTPIRRSPPISPPRRARPRCASTRRRPVSTSATCSSSTLSRTRSHSVQNPFNISDADWVRSVWNVMFKFWGDQNMTSDDVVKELKDQYDTIFG